MVGVDKLRSITWTGQQQPIRDHKSAASNSFSTATTHTLPGWPGRYPRRLAAPQVLGKKCQNFVDGCELNPLHMNDADHRFYTQIVIICR